MEMEMEMKLISRAYFKHIPKEITNNDPEPIT